MIQWLGTLCLIVSALAEQQCHEEQVCEKKQVCVEVNTNDVPIKIMQFNVQIFGNTKIKKQNVVDALIKIMKDQDVIQIQEVRDSSQVAIVIFMDKLNRAYATATEKEPFGMVISARQGRSNSKEQVAFIYRKSKVWPSRIMNFDDGPDDGTDAFERDPFVIEFRPTANDQSVKSFTIIGMHVKPSDVVSEMDHLMDVYEYVVKQWGVENVMIAGDMNADCSYLSNTKQKALKLTTDARFTWLIPDTMDTTVAVSACSYDRFIAAGPWVSSLTDAAVFDYGAFLGITDQATLEEISDHYPITVTLMGAQTPTASTPPTTSITAAPGSGNDVPIKIMQFNVQIFGLTKVGKQNVVDALIKIMKDQDVVQIQEVRDSSQSAIVDYMKQLNKACATTEEAEPFGYIVSARQGRSNSKEQVAFLFRKSKVVATRHMDFDDGPDDGTDAFERDPFVIEFQATGNDQTVKSFTIIGMHVKPGDVVSEMDHLVEVYEYVVKEWGVENVMIAGDMNADCSYLSNSKQAALKLTTDARFTWLTPDTFDTTVAVSACSYDRFIAAGPWVSSLHDSAVFDYGAFLGITDQEFLEDISDHYPITITLM